MIHTTPKVRRPDLNHPDIYELRVSEADLMFLADAIGTKCDELLRDINRCRFDLSSDTTMYGSEDATWLADAYARLASIHNQIAFLINNATHKQY